MRVFKRSLESVVEVKLNEVGDGFWHGHHACYSN